MVENRARTYFADDADPPASWEPGGADFRPTDTQATVLDTIEKDLDTAKGDYQKTMQTDVANFNKLASGRGLKTLSTLTP